MDHEGGKSITVQAAKKGNSHEVSALLNKVRGGQPQLQTRLKLTSNWRNRSVFLSCHFLDSWWVVSDLIVCTVITVKILFIFFFDCCKGERVLADWVGRGSRYFPSVLQSLRTHFTIFLVHFPSAKQNFQCKHACTKESNAGISFPIRWQINRRCLAGIYVCLPEITDWRRFLANQCEPVQAH